MVRAFLSWSGSMYMYVICTVYLYGHVFCTSLRQSGRISFIDFIGGQMEAEIGERHIPLPQGSEMWFYFWGFTYEPSLLHRWSTWVLVSTQLLHSWRWCLFLKT